MRDQLQVVDRIAMEDSKVDTHGVDNPHNVLPCKKFVVGRGGNSHECSIRFGVIFQLSLLCASHPPRGALGID